jgi:tRNA dimethylallyltransferase
MKKKIIVITGPTAVGKTDEAIGLAQRLSCPIISADSRQVYRELNIGVARPDQAQLAAAEHHFIGHVSIHENYNAGRFAEEGRHLVNQLFDTHQNLIICGGTGLYIQALLNGLDPLPGRDEALRGQLAFLLETEGIEALQNELRNIDRAKFDSIDIQNPQRLIRAIEIARMPTPERSGLPDFRHEFSTEFIKMECEREMLYDRINRRVDQMIEAGLEQEVRGLSAYRSLNALRTVGYDEWWDYFDGLVPLEQVVMKIKQHTRNYAKRQLTWIRHRF